MKKVRIIAYDCETGSVRSEMEKTLGEYSEWLERAIKRGYTAMDYKTCTWVVNKIGEPEKPVEFQVI